MKYLLALILTVGISASSVFEVTKFATKTGIYIKVTNKTSYYIVCNIGAYTVNIEPWGNSLWYKLPNKKISCRKYGANV